MNYTIKGRLHAAICDEKEIAVANTIVRLYALNDEINAVTAMATAQSKEVTQVYEEKEIKARKKLLLAETTTDENGNYRFEFDCNDDVYSGGAVAVSVFYKEVPNYGQEGRKPPRNFSPFEVQLDVFQPKWRENDNEVYANWNYRILRRVWCYILRRLDIWVICGTLRNCESQEPIKGIEVIAMDDDFITDDLLGSAVTDEKGQFCIFYRSIDFKKTFLSPFINVETSVPLSFDGGPDIYFKFAVGGSEFFAESPSEAQKPSRKNVGNCLCVDLCLDDAPDDDPEIPVAFYQIGENREYHPVVNIDPATGRTTGKATVGWNGQSFYSTLDLRGSLTREFNGQPAEYKFQYAHVANPGVEVGAISNWTDVTPGDIARTTIGSRVTGFLPFITVNRYVIHGTTQSTTYGQEIEVPFNGNWIVVPQDTGLFDIHFNGSLIQLISGNLRKTLTDNQPNAQTVDKAGLIPGSSSTPLEENNYFALRMLKREVGSATEVEAGFSRPLSIFNTRYENVPQGGSWLPEIHTPEFGIACVDLEQLATGGGCSKISNAITVNYTAANPNLGNVWITFTGQGATNNFETIVFPTPGEEAHGASNYLGDFGLLEPCAYEIRLNAEINLTNGEHQHNGVWDRVLFCR